MSTYYLCSAVTVSYASLVFVVGHEEPDRSQLGADELQLQLRGGARTTLPGPVRSESAENAMVRATVPNSLSLPCDLDRRGIGAHENEFQSARSEELVCCYSTVDQSDMTTSVLPFRACVSSHQSL